MVYTQNISTVYLKGLVPDAIYSLGLPSESGNDLALSLLNAKAKIYGNNVHTHQF